MLDFLSKFGLKPYKKQVVVHGFIRPRPTPKPRAEGSSPSAPATVTILVTVSFC